MTYIPTKVFLTRGAGRHKDKLTSFEMALRSAGIAEYNLVRISSIIPPNAEIISIEEGRRLLKPGQIVFCVLSDNATKEPRRLISASVGMARPRDTSILGYLSEHHCFGETEKVAGDYVEDVAAEMLATTLGIEGFDPDKNWDEKRDIYRMSDKIVETKNMTMTAIGDESGKWTTVIAAAILIC